MSDVECITLDDSGDDSPPNHGFGGAGVTGVAHHPGHFPPAPPTGHGFAANYQRTLGRSVMAPIPVVREEQMMRCNLCVDPGLLPVEEDRAAHR